MLYSYDAIRNYEFNKGLEVSLHCHCLLSVDQTLSEMLRCLKEVRERIKIRISSSKRYLHPTFTGALFTIDMKAT